MSLTALRFETAVRAVLVALVAVTVLARGVLLWRQPFHCDEFFFLSRLYELHYGELGDRFQTFALRALEWLTLLPGDEAKLLFLGRMLMLALSVASLFLLYRLCLRFFSPSESLLAVFGYATLSNVLEHGAAFRLDPICTVVILFLLQYGFTLGAIVAGICWGILLLVSLKTVLFLPAFLFFCQWRNFRSTLMLLASTVCSFAVFLTVHAAFLAKRTELGVPSRLSTLAEKFLQLGPGVHGLENFLIFVSGNPLFSVLLAVGSYGILRQRLSRNSASLPLGQLCALLLIPVAVLFYRNAFAYFYPVLLAPLTLIIPQPLAFLRTQSKNTLPLLVVLLCGFAINGAVNYLSLWQQTNDSQRQVISRVHQLFPERVAYIDRCGMISSYRKVGLFMSTLVMDTYRQRGKPLYSELITTENPQFVLDFTPFVDWHGANATSVDQRYRLLSDDEAALSENFRPLEPGIFVRRTNKGSL